MIPKSATTVVVEYQTPEDELAEQVLDALDPSRLPITTEAFDAQLKELARRLGLRIKLSQSDVLRISRSSYDE